MSKLVTVTLEMTSGIVEDRAVNNWAFIGGEDASPTEITALIDQVWDFYDTAAAGATNAMGKYLSVFVDRASASHVISVYDIDGHLDGSNFGSPEQEETRQLTAAALSATALPGEVALRIRLEGVGRANAPVEEPDGADPGVEVDRPKQRRTGGPFFGPCNSSAASPLAGATQGRPSQTIIDDAQAAIVALNADVLTTLGDDMQLAVWSRQAAQIRNLEAVAVDDAWDTQRRRGRAPSQVFRTLL